MVLYRNTNHHPNNTHFNMMTWFSWKHIKHKNLVLPLAEISYSLKLRPFMETLKDYPKVSDLPSTCSPIFSAMFQNVWLVHGICHLGVKGALLIHSSIHSSSRSNGGKPQHISSNPQNNQPLYECRYPNIDEIKPGSNRPFSYNQR